MSILFFMVTGSLLSGLLEGMEAMMEAQYKRTHYKRKLNWR